MNYNMLGMCFVTVDGKSIAILFPSTVTKHMLGMCFVTVDGKSIAIKIVEQYN